MFSKWNLNKISCYHSTMWNYPDNWDISWNRLKPEEYKREKIMSYPKVIFLNRLNVSKIHMYHFYSYLLLIYQIYLIHYILAVASFLRSIAHRSFGETIMIMIIYITKLTRLDLLLSRLGFPFIRFATKICYILNSILAFVERCLWFKCILFRLTKYIRFSSNPHLVYIQKVSAIVERLRLLD